MVLTDSWILDGAEVVHNEAASFFQNFLSESSVIEPGDLSELIHRQILEVEKIFLCAKPMEVEVKRGVFSIPKESSPKPDGFGLEFYMSCWDIVKETILEVAKDFFQGTLLYTFYL